MNRNVKVHTCCGMGALPLRWGMHTFPVVDALELNLQRDTHHVLSNPCLPPSTAQERSRTVISWTVTATVGAQGKTTICFAFPFFTTACWTFRDFCGWCCLNHPPKTTNCYRVGAKRRHVRWHPRMASAMPFFCPVGAQNVQKNGNTEQAVGSPTHILQGGYYTFETADSAGVLCCNLGADAGLAPCWKWCCAARLPNIVASFVCSNCLLGVRWCVTGSWHSADIASRSVIAASQKIQHRAVLRVICTCSSANIASRAVLFARQKVEWDNPPRWQAWCDWTDVRMGTCQTNGVRPNRGFARNTGTGRLPGIAPWLHRASGG